MTYVHCHQALIATSSEIITIGGQNPNHDIRKIPLQLVWHNDRHLITKQYHQLPLRNVYAHRSAYDVEKSKSSIRCGSLVVTYYTRHYATHTKS